jgi:hypothetical protein
MADDLRILRGIGQGRSQKGQGRADCDSSLITSDLLRTARSPIRPRSCSQNVALSRPTFRQVIVRICIPRSSNFGLNQLASLGRMNAMAPWAEQLAQALLQEPLRRRWAHVQGVAARARSLAPVLGTDAYPGFARRDLCSIRTADERDELAEAVRSGFSAAGYPLADDDPPVPLTSGIDRAIRLSTAAAVLAVAGIAAYVSYWHASRSSGHMARPGSPPGWSRPRSTAWCTPVRCSSSCTRHGTGSRCLPWPGGCSGWGSRPPSRRTWPRAGPTVWSGRWSRPGRRPVSWAPMSSWSGSSAPPDGRTRAACPAGASATRQARHGNLRLGSPGRRLSPPAGYGTRRYLKAAAVNDGAVAAYRRSAQAGNPLSERKLAQMFGRTSRRWARARIAEARRVPSSGLMVDPAVTVGAESR